MTTEPPIDERHETHGDYTNTAQVSQHLKNTMRNARNWNRLSCDKKESLDLIMTKVSRIMSGEPNEPDHWLDIEGYAKLARERLGETTAAREARLSDDGHRVKLTPREIDIQIRNEIEKKVEEGQRITPTVLVKPWDKKQ